MYSKNQQAGATNPPSQHYGATNYLLAALAAATIWSKRGSPRKSSQRGLKRRHPEFKELGICIVAVTCLLGQS